MLERRTQQRGSLNMTWGLPVSEPLLPSMTDYHREVLRFVAMRLSKDADAVRKLEACRSWHEMSLVHNKWMQEIFRDYFREVTKMMDLTTKKVGERVVLTSPLAA